MIRYLRYNWLSVRLLRFLSVLSLDVRLQLASGRNDLFTDETHQPAIHFIQSSSLQSAHQSCVQVLVSNVHKQLTITTTVVAKTINTKTPSRGNQIIG